MGMVSADPAAVLEHEIGATPVSSGARFAGLSQSASLEFYAASQLLAERARFLTAAEGVAIAIGEGRDFVYSASTGLSVPAIHDVASAAAGIIGETVTKASPTTGVDGPLFHLIVPILREQKVAGYFELISSRAAFGQRETESVNRLAALAATAIELRDAAEQAETKIGSALAKRAAPLRAWHAPETSPIHGEVEKAAKALAVDVMPEKCWWCGFPISQGRKLCVDCEEKNLASISQAEKPMFETEPQESWMERHGYTVATVLVSALAAAIIYILR